MSRRNGVQNKQTRPTHPETIELKNGGVIKKMGLSYKSYMNCMTILYGPSGSGKTTILDEIMYLLKDRIPNVFAISPTNEANKTFTGKLPSGAIKKGIDLDQTINFLEDFVRRQRESTNIYNTANDMKTLHNLFTRVIDTKSSANVRRITKMSNELISQIKCSNSNIAEKRVQIDQIHELRDGMLTKLYKGAIRSKKDVLQRFSLTKIEKFVIHFIDFNPHAMIILDDCASRFKTWKKKSTIIKELFYEARQYNITTVITTQNDKEIDSELRSNAMISIFTNDQISNNNFTRSSNGYSKNVKAHALDCISSMCFLKPYFQKLIYLNNNPEPFRFIVANLYPKFRMCGDASWELDKKLKERQGITENQLIDKYTNMMM